MTDRQYFRFAKAWHGLRDYEHPPNDTVSILYRSLCGEVINSSWVKEADRVPADGHLCGNCSRIIAARTDIETAMVQGLAEDADRDRAVVAEWRRASPPLDDIPEPVASEQDDWSPV